LQSPHDHVWEFELPNLLVVCHVEGLLEEVDMNKNVDRTEEGTGSQSVDGWDAVAHLNWGSVRAVEAPSQMPVDKNSSEEEVVAVLLLDKEKKAHHVVDKGRMGSMEVEHPIPPCKEDKVDDLWVARH
jgi:hypothetical protein